MSTYQRSNKQYTDKECNDSQKHLYFVEALTQHIKCKTGRHPSSENIKPVGKNQARAFKSTLTRDYFFYSCYLKFVVEMPFWIKQNHWGILGETLGCLQGCRITAYRTP